MPRKSAKSILEAGRKHVEIKGMNSGSNCPRFIIRDLAGEEIGSRSVIIDIPHNPSAAKALRLLEQAAKENGAHPASNPFLMGPGEYAEGWADEHNDDPDLFIKAINLL